MKGKNQAVVQRCWRGTALVLASLVTFQAAAANAVLLGWSESGWHETDGGDVSVYSLAPPYSTLLAQLVVGGKLVKATNGLSVTYEAIADDTGSFNSTSIGKGNFSQLAGALAQRNLLPDQGLAGFSMPGPTNQPQTMAFDTNYAWFIAQGLPLTPYDDSGQTNSFPRMRLVARDASGVVLATTDVVLPVSAGMDCRVCHASGSQAAARPASGWVWDCDQTRDYKLNILRYHDEVRAGTPTYTNVLQQVGYNPAGLVATVLQDGHPVLCLRCHGSNALPGSGAAGMRPLTRLIHTKHAQVSDPVSGAPLDTISASSACLQCHAGPEQVYLRGAHRASVTADGALSMQCQSCHGRLSDVGAKARSGWLDEPSCQSCHTGTAIHNSGQLTYTNIFSAPGAIRPAADLTFATQTNTPGLGLSLFRASTGHGGLQCAACHGPAHAEWPGAAASENITALQIQGHVGALAECGACHPSVPSVTTGGPHGLHPIGSRWVSQHGDRARPATQCANCHGADFRGTALALMQSNQTLAGGERGLPQQVWRGFQIGCYNCHQGPSGEGDFARNSLPTVTNTPAATLANSSASIPLQAADPDDDRLTLHLVSQPAHGRVSLVGSIATYFPFPGFIGNDVFTFAAWDGYTDSNLGNATVTVNPGDCSLTASATVPAAALPGATVPFRAAAALTSCPGTCSYEWDFDDGSTHSTASGVCHTYAASGNYTWKLTVSANGQTQTLTGLLSISAQLGPAVQITVTQQNGVLTVSWPVDAIGTSLEVTSDPTDASSWQPVADPVSADAFNYTYQTPVTPDPQFFRVRRVP